jgi:DNA-3-methyladenine glycosylase I
LPASIPSSANFGEREVDRLLSDAGIIRSKVKINAAVNNARAHLELRDAGRDFSAWVWSFTDGAPIQKGWEAQGDVPAVTPLAVFPSC